MVVLRPVSLTHLDLVTSAHWRSTPSYVTVHPMDLHLITRLLLTVSSGLALTACETDPLSPASHTEADTLLVPTDLALLDSAMPDNGPRPDTDDTAAQEIDGTPEPDVPDPFDSSATDSTDSFESATDTEESDISIAEILDSRDTSPPPCSTGPDSDGDGRVDACDACRFIPTILLFDLHSDRRYGEAAIELLGCEYVRADIADFTAQLETGVFGLVLMDMPDARPEGAWSSALLNHISRGGAAIVGGQRLNQVSGPSVPATLGATWGAERQAPVSFTPTWTHPLYAAPYGLLYAGFAPNLGSPWTHNGAPLTPTAGRVWARANDGSAQVVESNGGRTFLNGFIFDDYPYDTDGDGRPDIVELLANQVSSAARHLREPRVGPSLHNVGAVETLRHELPILRGSTAHDTSAVTVHRGPTSHTFPVADRRFKALTLLEPGENWVTLETASAEGPAYTHLELDYVPQTNPRKVRLVYAIASDGDGRFDAPFGEPNDLASAKRRLVFSGRLLQSMMADRMHAANLGWNTFDLIRDPSHTPEVHVWRTSATTAQWHAMDGLQMWSWIWGHINELPACTDCKTMIMLGMTRYDAENDRALGHTALGGGGVALFGSGTLHTFAEGLGDLVSSLEDTRDVTTLQPPLFDDSGFRRSMWANYATGLGAILHELAHAFDLPHAVDYGDIVNRGFDHVNRLLMSHEPASATTATIPQVLVQHEPIFSTPNLGRLRWHRYTSLDNRSYNVNTAPQATLVGQQIRITAPAGLRVIGYAHDVGGDWQVASGELLQSNNPPTSFTLTKNTLSFLFPNESRIRLYLTDDQGLMNESLIVSLP